MIEQKLDYIHHNPVCRKWNLAEDFTKYIHLNARYYELNEINLDITHYKDLLKISELLNLKPEHISSERGIIIIKQSKGKKDRIAPLSTKIVDLLRIYFVAFKT